MFSMYIDESKARGFLMVAVPIRQAEEKRLQKELTSFRKKGQSKVHFVKESNSRRREFLSYLNQQSIEAQIYSVAQKRYTNHRERCLEAIARTAVNSAVSRIIIDQDDSVTQLDRRVLFRVFDETNTKDSISYRHTRSKSEPLLWIPDAVAWSYSRGGEWRSRISNLIGQESEL